MLKRILCLLLSFVILLSCVNVSFAANKTEESATQTIPTFTNANIADSESVSMPQSNGIGTTTETVEDVFSADDEIRNLRQGSLQTATSNDGALRVIITSDVHYQPGVYYYGVSSEERLQLWVDSIKAEHERQPIDLILVNGDVSLDHYFNESGTAVGTYMGDNKVSNTQKFIENYVSQLPKGVPCVIIPGNHEQYSNVQWKEYTGNVRQTYISMEGNLFILLDNFGNHLEPNVTANSTCSPSDVDYIKKIMAMHPDDKVWLLAHYINPNAESKAFCDLVSSNDRIMGVFGGHAHMNDVKNIAQWGNKPYAMTGTFARSGVLTSDNVYGEPRIFGFESKTLTAQEEAWRQANLQSFWGFRELVITPTSAASKYISVSTGNTKPYYFGQQITLNRSEMHATNYSVPENAPTENWGAAKDGIYYIGSPNDMLAFCPSLSETIIFPIG